MPLYEASFLGEPQPIKPVKKTKAKKTPEAPVPEPVAAPVESKPKTVRKRKAPEPATPAPETVQPVDDPAPYGLNKRGKPYKRPQKPRQEATPSASDASEVADPPVVKKSKGKQKVVEQEEEVPVAPKKKTKKAVAAENKKVIIDGHTADEPPAWFKAYLHDEAKRRNADKPKAERAKAVVVKHEADIKAHEKWSDGLVRDRVNNEVNSHMGRLYSQIYGRRF
jgi:hypothetical protein